jgi:hypothetical protein
LLFRLNHVGRKGSAIVCEESNVKQAQAQYEGAYTNQAAALRPAYPHENLDRQISRNIAETQRLQRAKEFLDKNPQFKDFLTLVYEGVLHVRG